MAGGSGLPYINHDDYESQDAFSHFKVCVYTYIAAVSSTVSMSVHDTCAYGIFSVRCVQCGGVRCMRLCVLVYAIEIAQQYSEKLNENEAHSQNAQRG